MRCDFFCVKTYGLDLDLAQDGQRECSGMVGFNCMQNESQNTMNNHSQLYSSTDLSMNLHFDGLLYGT